MTSARACPSDTKEWITRPTLRPDAGIVLFCFPYAGGGAEIFRSWATLLDPSIEPALVHLPGRGRRMRDPLLRRMDAMVHQIADAMLPQLGRPFAFFGHSMGALIAFEVARRLSDDGFVAERLFLSACPPPQRPRTAPWVHTMTDQELTRHLAALRGTPADTLRNTELLRIVLPIVRADFELVETHRYRPRPPLSSPFSVFHGAEDQDTGPADIACWRELTSGQCDAELLQGDHFFVNTAYTDLLRLINAKLGAAVRV